MFFSRHITRNTLTYGQTEFVLAGSLKRKNDITRCYYNLLCRYELRRQDSNMRPPGYEPGELPTAPLRDINITFYNPEKYSAMGLLLNCECKGMTFL